MEARTARKVGLWSFIAVILIVALWDSIMQGVFGLQHTVSWAVWEATAENPIITVAIILPLGIVIGHLFWPGYSVQARKEIDELKRRLSKYEPV